MWRTALRVSAVCVRRPSVICASTRLPVLLPPAAERQLCVRRGLSSQGPASPRVIVIDFNNPLTWLASKANLFFIRLLLDPELNMKEFVKGARQAFLFVSEKLSENKLDELENVLHSGVLKVLQNKGSDDYKKDMAVKSNEIVRLSPRNVELHFDKNGIKSVYILMRYWYMKDVDPEDNTENTAVHKFISGSLDVMAHKRIITANYVFRREYSPAGTSDWIITYIGHD